MDPRFLRLYEQELRHVREMGAEFAQDFPKIAGRLGLEGIDCTDPYVERLLEGFAFMAARVQLQLESEHPRFTEQMLQAAYPTCLAPVPSMAIVEYQPKLAEAGLATGLRVPRGSVLRATLAKDEVTAVEYSTAHAVALWPLQVAGARYYATSAGLGLTGTRGIGTARAGLRLSFEVTAGLKCPQLALDELDVHLAGADELPRVLYEALFAGAIGYVVRSPDGTHEQVYGPAALRRLGFDDGEALLPALRRTFSGHRLLQEYFTLPERFLFARFTGLRQALARIPGNAFELIVLFDRPASMLESAVGPANFRLGCTPAINLVERRADRILLNAHQAEYQVVVDRTRPVDFEVVDVLRAEGYSSGAEPECRFEPFYGARESTWHARERAFFTLRREQRVQSLRQKRFELRSRYVGSETFVQLVDSNCAPYAAELRQLECRVLCSNRDLPFELPVGKGRSDFQLEGGAPIEAVRVLGKPSRPRPSPAVGQTAWRLISHLSLNFDSLLAGDPERGAYALREALLLYADPADPAQQRQIEGVRELAAKPVVARTPVGGPVALARGLEIVVTLDDTAFAGSGSFVLAAVLEEYLARYASINSFTRTVLRTADRGEVKRWPARTGRRPAL